MNAPETQIALVTGASRGIGAAIAERLAASGFLVVVNYRDSQPQAEEVVRRIQAQGGQASPSRADVTELAGCRKLIESIQQQWGRLDVLVNCAGRSQDGLLLLTPHEQWWSVFQDNVAAIVNCTRAALPLLLQGEKPAIINISSISGVRGIEGQTAYSAAKAAVIGFTKALARELARKNISINCVAPGPIDTEMYRSVNEQKRQKRLESIPLGRIGRTEEVAEVVAFLAEGRARFIHGQTLNIDGGATI
jgi:3-oxoacyl-[acyl-carrier protein] reductase